MEEQKHPLVSILIPLYNSEKYILETLDSCINQTYDNIEIIIVDDGSTDNSLKIVAEIQQHVNNVKVFAQTNSGAPSARNKAFSESNGELIVFLDADDLLDKHKIENQVISLKNSPKETISFGQFLAFYKTIEEKKIKLRPINKNHNTPIDFLLTEKYFHFNSTLPLLWMIPCGLVTKVGGWREDMIINQDMDFIYRVILNCNKIIFSKNTYSYYRRDNLESISSTFTHEKGLAVIQSNLDIEKELRKFENSLRVDRFFAKKHKYSTYNYFFENDDYLIEKAFKEYQKFGIHNVFVGPRRFQMLNRVFTFKTALKIELFLRTYL